MDTPGAETLVTAAQPDRPADPGRSAPTARALDVRTMIELSQHSLFDRVAFSAIYAAISLFILPWQAGFGWIVAIAVWEWAIAPVLERGVTQLPEDQAAAAFSGVNLIGSAIYSAMAVMCLANGSGVGVAMATTWICGSVLNSFVYSSASRALLAATLAPTAATAIIGPWLAYGLSWNTLIIPALLGLASLASQRFSLDHDALSRQLADRQAEFTDLERKLSIAIEASGDGMFESDIPAGELHPSPTWLAMLGYAPGDVETPVRDWRVFVHPDDIAQLEADYGAHFRGETPHTTAELRMRCKDGEYKWVLSRARVVSRLPDGRPWMLVGTTVDISARKALEHQLEAARDLAEAANRAKSIFIANMSHEIRTPLNGVIGVAGALARTALSPPQREMVDLVQSSGQMLDRMLSDILDQAKIEAGNFQLQIASFDLRQEVEAAAELMRARADEKGLGFQIAYGEAADGVFEGDAVRLRQIISNLTSNAIKFTQAGEVAIRVEAEDSADAQGRSLLRIDVADSGVGFDAETGSRLFNRFVQADGSISREFGGTGLGLAICKTLTELMGGQITVRSQPGQGSVFSVQIPLARTIGLADYRQQRMSAATRGEETFDAAGRLARTRILLAEDHPTNQRVVQLILEPHDVDLTIVGNGREAVEVFRPGLFDLILMDMQMPVMDGLAATRAIRNLEQAAGGESVPIAMFSANAMDEHLVMAAQAGANHHIAKPITPERLLAGIEAALSQAAPQPMTVAS